MQNTQLARHSDVDMQAWGVMREQAQVLCRTGFLPEAIKTPEQAIAIMMKGREMGLPTMYALSNIAIIKGKPVAGAEVLQAVIYRDHGDSALIPQQTDEHACTVLYKRRDWPEHKEFTFTIEDAKKAGLLNNPTWQKYPQAMLRARCISAVARMAFADSIGGMYTPEELGAAVTVNDEGAVEMVNAPAVSTPQLAPAEYSAPAQQVEADPNPPLVTEADLQKYEELRDYAQTLGLPALGKLSLNSTRAKWAGRMERLELMIKAAEEAESPEPPADAIEAETVTAEPVEAAA